MIRRVRAGSTVVEYELRQTARSSVECRVSAEGAVVFAPKRMPLREIDAFVLQKAGWIAQAQAEMRRRAGQNQIRIEVGFSEGAPIPVEGQEYALRLLPGNRVSVSLTGQEIAVTGTDGSAEAVREAVRAFLVGRARDRLAERTAYYAKRVGRSPNRIAIRDQKTKWGSCSAQGNLNFNWKLIMAPPQALDYVVVHELCHLIEMNHSPAFWAQVKRHMPDYEIWQGYLKKGIQSPFG